jgi:hypothetical protein
VGLPESVLEQIATWRVARIAVCAIFALLCFGCAAGTPDNAATDFAKHVVQTAFVEQDASKLGQMAWAGAPKTDHTAEMRRVIDQFIGAFGAVRSSSVISSSQSYAFSIYTLRSKKIARFTFDAICEKYNARIFVELMNDGRGWGLNTIYYSPRS